MRKMQNISALSAIEVTELMLNFKVIKKLVLEQVKCDECGKEICNSFILKRQEATVHGIKPKDDFQCEHCPMFFSYRSTLDKHVASKHLQTNQ